MCAIFQKVKNFDMRTWVFWFMECVPLCELFFLRIPFFLHLFLLLLFTYFSLLRFSFHDSSFFFQSIYLKPSFHKPPNKSLK